MLVKTFVLYFLCICLPISFLLGSISYDKINREREKYYISLNEINNHISNIFIDKFTTITDMANNIFLSSWYKHYRNKSGIYDSEFDILKRMEISEDLKIKTASLDFVSNFLVVTPSLDSIISKTGWFSMKDYESFYGHISIESGTGKIPPIVKCNSEHYCLITLNDPITRADSSLICILIDKALFAKYFFRLQNDLMSCIDVEINGQLLYQYKRQQDTEHHREGKSYYTITVDSKRYPYFRMDVLYPDYNSVLLSEDIYKLKMQLMVAILSSIVIALLLTFINFKPLNVLLKRFSPTKFSSTADAYKYIDSFFEDISSANLELKRENRYLTSSVSKFFSQMHNEIMFSMVTNPNFDFTDEYVCNNMPWINDNLPFIMVLYESRNIKSGFTIDLSMITKCSFFHSTSFRILENECCMIFWFHDRDSAILKSKSIKNQLIKLSGDDFFIGFSDMLYDLSEMHEWFKSLKYNISMKKQLNFELPISVQIDFITSVKNTEHEECLRLINISKYRYKPESFLILLLRIAQEYDIDTENILPAYRNYIETNNYPKLWNIITGFTGDIIMSICASKSNNSAKTAELLRKFIDTNFRNPNMSIKLLSETFNLDGTLISKIFKAEMGLTFSDYLLNKRMNLAMDLLNNPEMSLTSISESVGYVHYLSFKRAFTRYKGVSPKEYREFG